MKKLAMVVCLLAFGVAVASTDSRPLNTASAKAFSAASPALAGAAPQVAKTYTGRIAKMNGAYVLISGTDMFQLDNQERAKAFDGLSVKVIGRLDTTSNTIYVSDIEAA
jgi:hypothetical protein